MTGGVTMPKFTAGLILGALIFGLLVHVSRGQVAGARVKNKDIPQGDILNMDISVDRAPNLDGTLFARIGPDGDSDRITLTCNLNNGGTVCQAGTRLPLDAKVGKWTIRNISFQTSAPSPEKKLTAEGDLSFQVVPHGEIILPDSATISNIK